MHDNEINKAFWVGRSSGNTNSNIMNVGGGIYANYIPGGEDAHARDAVDERGVFAKWCQQLTVSRPAGVALRAVGRVGGGHGGNAGTPDEAKRCQAACGETTGDEPWSPQARLARFEKQRPGGRGHGRGLRCCRRWSRRRNRMGENLIFCWKSTRRRLKALILRDEPHISSLSRSCTMLI